MNDVVVGEHVLKTPLSLAPMVGLSHTALRNLVMELGGVGLLYTEMLSATRLPGDNPHISPFLVKSQEERPLIYQLYLSKNDVIDAAVDKIEQLDGQGIDLNLGCPAPKLRRQGAGVYLSSDKEKLAGILSDLRKKTNLPLSVKIRLGAGPDKEKFTDYCKMLEACGVDLVTIHARFNKDKFCRKPHWHWVRYAKEVLSIPVFANGGIFTVEDALNCLKVSGADGLMLGRGAVIRPWLFCDVYSALQAGEVVTRRWNKKEVYDRFFELVESRFEINRQLGRVKQFTTLFAESFLFGHILATTVQKSKSMDEAKMMAEQFFETNPYMEETK